MYTTNLIQLGALNHIYIDALWQSNAKVRSFSLQSKQHKEGKYSQDGLSRRASGDTFAYQHH